MKHIPWATVVTIAMLSALAAVAWWWQQAIKRQPVPTRLTEPWEHVRNAFPMPAELKPPQETGEETLQAIVRANPFSPQRYQAPPASEGASGNQAPAETVPPQYVYKGRVLMGAKQRAVVEDVTSKKTFFREVGQPLGEFKVLDISETQVVLSKPDTQEKLVLSLTPKQSKP